MRESIISKLIAEHDLKPGQPMKNVSGNDIASSVILNSRMVLIKMSDDTQKYALYREDLMTSEETVIYFGDQEMNILKNINF